MGDEGDGTVSGFVLRPLGGLGLPYFQCSDPLGCDFFEHRGEKRIDVGTLLMFLFFFFRWRPMFLSCFFV